MYMCRNGGGSDILVEPITIALMASVTWKRKVACSETIFGMYQKPGMTSRKVAKELGISKTSVITHLQKWRSLR